jgi:hypothetical protein
MSNSNRRWSALVLACLLLAACREKHEPVKPTVEQPAIGAITAP